MDGKFMLLIYALLATLLLVEGGRNRGSGGRRRGSRQGAPAGSRYSWSRDLGSDISVQEDAAVPADVRLVQMRSTDDSLTAAGYTKSLAFYNFTTTTPKLVITLLDGRRGSPCYIVNTTLTYQATIDLLTVRNNSVAPLGLQVSLDGSSGPLPRQVARAVITSNPSLRRICPGSKIVITSTTPATSTNATEVIKVLTIDSVVNLRVSTATESSQGGRGGRRGGGGRGEGRRGRN